MAVCDDCFEEFAHPLFHEAKEKNDQFWQRYGPRARWNWDDERSILTFSDPNRPSIEIDVSIVGTTEGNSSEWAWANKNIPQHNKLGIEKVREFGEANGYDKLTTPFLDADDYADWEMTSIAVHLLGGFGSYRFATDKGYCYLVYRNIRELTVQ